MGWINSVMRLLGIIAAIARLITTTYGHREDKESAQNMRNSLNGIKDVKEQ